MIAESVATPASTPIAGARDDATARPFTISIEAATYLTLMTFAALTRFWDLGSRALHHDESLHAFYSWQYATGGGYIHNPLMHGPFLFHANALVYFFFGASDASSRYVPALFGVLMVGLPYLLRGPRLLGRWGALAAACFFLVSPSLLYYSRYIRHDIYSTTGTLLLFACIVRFLERPERRWLVTAGLTIGFLFTNHEIVFAILVIFGGLLYAAYLTDRIVLAGPKRKRTALQIVGIHLAALSALAALVALTPHEYRNCLLDIPWDRSGNDAPRPTPENQLAYYRDLVVNPLVIGLIVILAGTFAAVWHVLRRTPVSEGPTLIANGLGQAWRDRRGLAFAALGIVAVAVPLFTTLFTNLAGLATATFATDGTLLYWLGQHEVRRGDQPCFYFLLLMPRYELIAVVFGGAGAVLTLISGARRLVDGAPLTLRLIVRLFLTGWLAGIFLGLSWAGEKMPWLVVHIALPAILLAAAMLNDVIVRWRRDDARIPTLSSGSVVMALLALGAGWLFLAARMTAPDYMWTGGGWARGLDGDAVDHWWRLLAAPSAACLFLGISWWRLGSRRAGQIALTALTAGLVLMQVHLGWRLAFQEGDVAKEMLIYNTTSPDVTRIVREIGMLSDELTGGKDLEIWYNGCADWPLNWYLRDFPNRHAFGGTLPQPPPDAPIVLASTSPVEGCPSLDAQLSGYSRQDYILRWHAPEDTTYRHFAIAPELAPGQSAWTSADQPHGPRAVARSILSSLATLGTMDGQQRLYRLVMYQELPSPTWNYPLTLYIRADLVPLYNGIRY